MTDTKHHVLTLLPVTPSNNAQGSVNTYVGSLDIAALWFQIVDRNLLTPPGSPNLGDAYIMPSGTLTGAWATFSEHDIAYSHDGVGWTKLTPKEGWAAYVIDENIPLIMGASAWAGLFTIGHGMPEAAFVADLIDSSTGTPDGTVAAVTDGGDGTTNSVINDNFAECAAQDAAITAALINAGIMASS